MHPAVVIRHLITGKAGVAQTLLSVLVMLAKPENINQVTVITTRRDHVYGQPPNRAPTLTSKT